MRIAAGAAFITNLVGALSFKPIQLVKRPFVRLEQGVSKLAPILLGLPLVMFGYWVVFIFIAPFASLKVGLDDTQVATVVAAMSLTNGIGRVIWGWVSDQVGALPIFTFNVIAKAVLVAFMPLAPSLGSPFPALLT